MNALASADQVATLLMRDLTTREVDAVELLLELVTGEIEEAVGVNFTGGARTVELAGTWDSWIELPSAVTGIASVALNGTALDVGGYTWTAGRLVRRGPSQTEEFFEGADGLIVRQGAQPWVGEFHWGGPASVVTVTYDAPTSDVPGWLTSLALTAVRREFENPQHIIRESLGAYAVMYEPTTADTDPSTGLLTGGERDMLTTRYRRVSTTIIPTAR